MGVCMYCHHSNKTAVQSQNRIAGALFALLGEKSFQQITVTELCEAAAVGRKTFYRNFELKEDVVDFRLDQFCEQYKAEIVGMDSEGQLRHHMEFTQRYADSFIALYRNGFYEAVREKFAVLLPQTMPNWTEDPVEQQYRGQYIVGGVEAIERVWVERGFRESVDQVVEFVRRAQNSPVPAGK